jgi:hypothetical protein
MASQKRRDRSLHIEFLEQRQTLSTIAGRPSIIQSLTTQTAVIQFAVGGSGVLTNQTRMPDGSMMIRAVVHGHSTPLGEFTGRFLIMVPNNGPPIVAKANLRAQDGAVQLTITLTDLVLGGGDSGPPLLLHGTFSITGGTSQFARPGGGTASVRVDPMGMSFTFVLKGEIGGGG